MGRVCGLWVAVLVVMTGCRPVPESAQQMQARLDRESAMAAQSVADIARRYERWLAAGQADSIANSFTEQGREMPPNEPAAVGREAIRSRQARLAGWGAWRIHLTSEATQASGPLAVERGSYALTFKPGRKAPRGTRAFTDNGKYLAHWHEAGGEWQIAEIIWNSNPPPPKPPKAGKRK